MNPDESPRQHGKKEPVLRLIPTPRTGRPDRLIRVLARAYNDVAARLGSRGHWCDLSWRQRQIIRVMWQAATTGTTDPDQIAETAWRRARAWSNNPHQTYREWRTAHDRDDYRVMAERLLIEVARR